MSRFKLNRYDEGKNYWSLSMSVITSLVLFLLLLGVIGYRYNLLSASFSLLYITKYAVYASIIASAISLISIGYSLKLYKKFINIVLSIFMLSINIRTYKWDTITITRTCLASSKGCSSSCASFPS